MKLQSFKSWFYSQYPGLPLKTIIKWTATAGIVEIPVLCSGTPAHGELSLTLPTCKHHDIDHFQTHAWLGTEMEDGELLKIWVLLGTTVKQAQEWYINPPDVSTTRRYGERKVRSFGHCIPTSYPAACRWLEHHNIVPLGKPVHLSNYTPDNEGVNRFPTCNYYKVDIPVDSIDDKSVLNNIPHKRTAGNILSLYLKSYGYQKGSVTLNKLLSLAQAVKTEDVCITYASAFLETPVPGVDISKIDWTAPNVGLQIIKAVKWPNTNTNVGLQPTDKEVQDDHESTMGIPGFDF